MEQEQPPPPPPPQRGMPPPVSTRLNLALRQGLPPLPPPPDHADRPNSNLTLSVRGWRESEAIPTLDPHGLAAWIFLKLSLGDEAIGECPKINMKHEHVFVASLETPEQNCFKNDDSIDMSWLNSYKDVDADVRSKVASFQTEVELLYPKLEQLKNFVIGIPGGDARDFDSLFDRLSNNLGNNAYLYTTDDSKICCISSIDAIFLSLAIITNEKRGSLGNLHASLHKHKNLSAYIDKVYWKCRNIPVIDFSEQLVEIKINSIDQFISKIIEPGDSSSVLGRGDYGEVRSCNVQATNPFRLPQGECAVKCFKAGRHDFSEMQLSTQLNHERFPRLIGRGRGKHLCFLVMTVAKGGDARKFGKSKRSILFNRPYPLGLWDKLRRNKED